ncbi:MAG: thioredoxin family protein [Candidatus Theseobacter exili]|nr:thioredoxin family protein [Candidatus Theseobacter exili]
MKIEVLGMGCPKCKNLYDNVQKALALSGKQADIVKVEDLMEITEYGVMATPALVIDGTVRSYGKVLSAEEIKSLL